MDKERILELCQRLMWDIFFAERCLNCQTELATRITSGEKLFHEDFFLLAKQSFLYTGTIILCMILANLNGKLSKKSPEKL